MTIAISIKINDGVVLASDSASTIISGTNVINIYENTNKIFNLYKGLPIGAITWGLGNIGSASIDTLTKDFRRELKEKINVDSYKISDIAHMYSNYIYQLYNEHFKNKKNDEKPNLGFMVVGYSKNAMFAEEYIINIKQGKLEGPTLIRGEKDWGMTWNGEIEPITRLYFGFSNFLPHILKEQLNLKNDELNRVMESLKRRLTIPLVIPSMPIQDAIYLAEFLVDFVIKFSKFRPGAPTVGGPIEIAAITKHEGFKWVKRKHYYSKELNPKEVNDHE